MPDEEDEDEVEEPTTLKDAVFNIFVGWCEGRIGLAKFVMRMKNLQGAYIKDKEEGDKPNA